MATLNAAYLAQMQKNGVAKEEETVSPEEGEVKEVNVEEVTISSESSKVNNSLLDNLFSGNDTSVPTYTTKETKKMDIGKSILDLHIMQSGSQGSEDIKKIKERVDNGYLNDTRYKEIISNSYGSFIISNDEVNSDGGTLHLSCLVLYMKFEKSIMTYPFLFPQTNTDPVLTIDQFLQYRDEMIMNSQNNLYGVNDASKNKRPAYTPDVVIDSNFTDILKEKTQMNLNMAEGDKTAILINTPVIIPSTYDLSSSDDRNTIADKIVNSSMIAFITHYYVIYQGYKPDGSIGELIGKDTGYEITIDMQNTESSVRSDNGDVCRAEFSIKNRRVTISKNNKDQKSYNSVSGDKSLVTVSGYMDAIPELKKRSINSFTESTVVRFMPHVILTNIAAMQPTVNLFLLGLVSATSLVKKETCLAFFKNNRFSQLHNPNGFEKFAKLGNELSNKDKLIDYREKTLDDTLVNNLLAKTFEGNTVISLDYIPYTGANPAANIFFKIASGLRSTNSNVIMTQNKAIQEIVKHLDIFTNGKFTAKYNPRGNGTLKAEDIIIASYMFPAGYYLGEGGKVCDLRNFDFSALANKVDNNKIQLVADYVNAAKFGVTDEAVFTILKSLNSGLGLNNGFVTGRGIRMTFNPNFIMAIQECIREFENLNLTCKGPSISFSEEQNFGNIGDIYGAAGFTSGFQVSGGQNFQSLFASNPLFTL